MAAQIVRVGTVATIVCMQMKGSSERNPAGTMLQIASTDLYKQLFLLLQQRTQLPPSTNYPN